MTHASCYKILSPDENFPEERFSDTTNAIAYYLPGTLGWGTNFGGLRTALWLPVIQTSDSNFGLQNNVFGFTVDWASGHTITLEACSDLARADWVPIATESLSSHTVYFSDPTWTNISQRFYRVRFR